MRFRAAVFARLAFLGALALPAAHGAADKSASERELRELRARIQALQQRLADAEKTSGEAADQLRESGRAVSEAHRALFALAESRKRIEGELEAIARREADTRAAIARNESLAGKLLKLQYRQRAPDRLRLALEGRDAATVSRHLAYYGYIQNARAELLAKLRGQADELAALERDARARRDELTENHAAQAREARRLEQERAARAGVATRLAADLARGRKEMGKLKRDEARLSNLVEDLARALARPAPPGRRRGEPIDEVADASVAAKPFASLKGHLKLPVRGELMNRYGAAREETGGTWKGLFIRSTTGETVRAVADGQVVYADWLRGFGNLLILDHGRGYMSLYAHNEGLLRQVGEKVRGGDPIAHVGQAETGADSGVYFELRRAGKPFDPMAWVAQ